MLLLCYAAPLTIMFVSFQPGFEPATSHEGDRDRAMLLAALGENNMAGSEPNERGQSHLDGHRHATVLQGPFSEVKRY